MAANAYKALKRNQLNEEDKANVASEIQVSMNYARP